MQEQRQERKKPSILEKISWGDVLFWQPRVQKMFRMFLSMTAHVAKGLEVIRFAFYVLGFAPIAFRNARELWNGQAKTSDSIEEKRELAKALVDPMISIDDKALQIKDYLKTSGSILQERDRHFFKGLNVFAATFVSVKAFYESAKAFYEWNQMMGGTPQDVVPATFLKRFIDILFAFSDDPAMPVGGLWKNYIKLKNASRLLSLLSQYQPEKDLSPSESIKLGLLKSFYREKISRLQVKLIKSEGSLLKASIMFFTIMLALTFNLPALFVLTTLIFFPAFIVYGLNEDLLKQLRKEALKAEFLQNPEKSHPNFKDLLLLTLFIDLRISGIAMAKVINQIGQIFNRTFIKMDPTDAEPGIAARFVSGIGGDTDQSAPDQSLSKHLSQSYKNLTDIISTSDDLEQSLKVQDDQRLVEEKVVVMPPTKERKSLDEQDVVDKAVSNYTLQTFRFV